MSAPLSVPSSSKKRKRPIVGNQGKGEGSGGPDPEDLEIRSPSAPPLRVRSDGQGEKYCIGWCPNHATTDDAQQNQKSAASVAAKSILYRLTESPNAYPPLKSVAVHLWYILDNCEVWDPSHTFTPQHLQWFQQMEVNWQAIESLVPRIRILSESLREPITAGDLNEKRREKERERELEQ